MQNVDDYLEALVIKTETFQEDVEILKISPAEILDQIGQSELSTSNIEAPKEEITIGPIQISVDEKPTSELLPVKIEAVEETAGPTQIWVRNDVPSFATVKIEPFKEENVEGISIDPVQFLGKDDPSELPAVRIESPKDEKVGEIGNENILNPSIEGGNKIPNQLRVVNNLQPGERLIFNFQNDVNKGCQDRTISRGTIWYDIFKTVQTGDYQDDLDKITVTEAPATASIIEPHEFTTLNAFEHRCNHCQQLFKNVGIIRRHIRCLHRETTKQYHCPYCPFKSKWPVGQHITFKHKDDNNIRWFNCDSCNRKFKTKADLTVHTYTHLSTEQLANYMKPCSLCEKTFKTAAALRRHIKFVHNKEPLQCKECHYNIMNPGAMRKHVEVHHTSPEQRGTYECEQCDYKTTYKYEFKKHYNRHKASYCCERCSFVASSTARLKEHQITHKAKVDEHELKYRCDKCNYKTYREYSLTVHKLNHLKPDEIQYFYCHHCGFKTKRKDNLKTHVLKHFQKDEVTFQCFRCNFRTRKRALITQHLQNHSKAQ